ncbi:MAG: DNA primase, partial [Chloroflexi bacterium]
MSIIETIKAKINVVEEIGLVVALQKSGKALKGLCPFHNERTPSFYVFAETQTWRCFGCNEGGDVFSFVEKQQGLEFREALQYLAEKAGVSVDDFSGQDPEQARETNALKERMRNLNEDALLWFHQMLLRSKEAAEARAYVQSRGISADTVVTFSLGYAPEQWDGLSRFLLGRGYTERELVNGGLARDRDGGLGGSSSGIYDYFRHRLIFPIRDMRGRVIGFGGRAFGEDQPKYLNSPQTLLFEKNSVLYALDMARDTIKLAKQVVIVEGYVDAVIAHQHGTKQTVACIGSAITEKHIQQLKKLTRQVTLALDPDAAGASATEHGIQEALKTFDRTIVPIPLSSIPRGQSAKKQSNAKGMIRLEEQVDAEINVLELPPGEDPDEVIKENPSLWDYRVSHPIPLMDYFFKEETADLNLREPAGKTEAAKRLLPLIGIIPDRVKRDEYARKLASMIRVDERSLRDELQQVLRE